MSGFGVFLAIATAFSWALGCVVHTTASRVVGIPAVMLIRQPLASVVLGIFCLVMGDLWLPSLHLFWLAAASGVFGIIIGDACQYAGALTPLLRCLLDTGGLWASRCSERTTRITPHVATNIPSQPCNPIYSFR